MDLHRAPPRPRNLQPRRRPRRVDRLPAPLQHAPRHLGPGGPGPCHAPQSRLSSEARSRYADEEARWVPGVFGAGVGGGGEG